MLGLPPAFNLSHDQTLQFNTDSGFEKTLNLAQQSQKTLEFTSVTCDADNLATITRCIHKHPHELLDSVVKERFDLTEGLNRGRAFYSGRFACQALF